MSAKSPRSLRRAYLDWVEEQVEDFKESIPRARLLAIADEVVNELRVARGGQYQLTEVLLCSALDRYLVRLLKIPGYRAWAAQRRAEAAAPPAPVVIPIRDLALAHAAREAPAPVAAEMAEDAPEPLACVV